MKIADKYQNFQLFESGFYPRTFVYSRFFPKIEFFTVC